MKKSTIVTVAIAVICIAGIGYNWHQSDKLIAKYDHSVDEVVEAAVNDMYGEDCDYFRVIEYTTYDDICDGPQVTFEIRMKDGTKAYCCANYNDLLETYFS